MITQFGINMLVPIILCTFLGIWLDKKLGTEWIMVVMFFVGALAGGRNVYIFAKRIYSMEGDTRNRDLAEENNKKETAEEVKKDAIDEKKET